MVRSRSNHHHTRRRWLLGANAAVVVIACSVGGAEAQQEVTVFQFQNRASNRCIRVEAPPPKAIIAGRLTTFGCGKSPDRLIEISNDAPAFLRFDLGKEQFRCVNVRGLDTKKIPSDIFANTCGSPTSRWHIGGPDAEGFGDVRLFSLDGSDTLCLSEATIRRTVIIDTCSETKREQRWKRIPVRITKN